MIVILCIFAYVFVGVVVGAVLDETMNIREDGDVIFLSVIWPITVAFCVFVQILILVFFIIGVLFNHAPVRYILNRLLALLKFAAFVPVKLGKKIAKHFK